MANLSTSHPTTLGPYELVERIATGGMAEVYLAWRAGPHGFHKTVAVKRILPQLAEDPEFVSMFVDEARISARLCHPNVVQVFDFGEQDGELYMAMEYVEGTTVAQLMRAAALAQTPLGLEVVLHIVLSVLRALEHAHTLRGESGQPLRIVHRDVSPGNVLVARSGEVTLTDFGIVRGADLDRRTSVGVVKGKLGYMSPEQVLGRELDPRSDLFTVGIVFAELLVLRPLFGAGSDMEVLTRIRDVDLGAFERAAQGVPDDVKRVVHRALAADPTQRYASAAAFCEAIEEIVRRRRIRVAPRAVAQAAKQFGLLADDAVAEAREATSIRQRGRSGITGPPDSQHGTLPPASGSEEPEGPSYRIQLPGLEQALGPLSFAEIVALLVTGRVSDRARIARDGGAFHEPLALSEMRRFVSSPALRWDDQAADENSLRAPLDRRELPGQLFRLANARETGLLFLSDGDRRKKIYFVDGVPEFVVSTDPRELLGEFLVSQGTVLRSEMALALRALQGFEGRLGDALVGLGILRPVQLFRAIFEQVEARFLEIFRWTRGELLFIRGRRSYEETVPLGFDLLDLVVRGVRAHYAAAEIALFLEGVQGGVRPSPRPPGRIEALRLTESEERLLRNLLTPATIFYLASRESLPLDVVHRAIFLGLASEYLVTEGWGRGSRGTGAFL